MYTALIGLAVSALVSTKPEAQTSPDWQTDYKQAKAIAGREQKPMAVVIGAGAQGWNKLIAEGAIGPASQELLRSNYVCLYVDLQKPAGKELAEAFEFNGPALILSDRGGEYQAQRRGGAVSDTEFGQLLSRNLQRASLKADPAPQQQQAPAYYYPNYCPNCRR